MRRRALLSILLLGLLTLPSLGVVAEFASSQACSMQAAMPCCTSSGEGATIGSGMPACCEVQGQPSPSEVPSPPATETPNESVAAPTEATEQEFALALSRETAALPLPDPGPPRALFTLHSALLI